MKNIAEALDTLDSVALSYLSKRKKENCSFTYKIGKDSFNSDFSEITTLQSKEKNFIYLHDKFIKGQQGLNSTYSKLLDYKELGPYSQYFIQFFKSLFVEEKLVGRNKPSWMAPNGKENSHLKNYWHYHCGPYDDTQKTNNGVISSLNEENPTGKTSAPVIHYFKYIDDDESKNPRIIIVGFATEHSNKFDDKNRIES